MLRSIGIAALLAPLAAPLGAATFTVTSTADSGAGSLRQAITDANAAGGRRHDRLRDRRLGGPHDRARDRAARHHRPGHDRRLHAVGSLAEHERHEPGFEHRAPDRGRRHGAAALRHLPRPRREPTRPSGDSSSTGCEGTGIRIQNTASNAVIEGNFIGTDPTGTTADANRPHYGINGAAIANVRIGGTTPAARNLLSGGFNKIHVGDGPFGPTGPIIQGNLIGTDAAGTAACPTPARESSCGRRRTPSSAPWCREGATSSPGTTSTGSTSTGATGRSSSATSSAWTSRAPSPSATATTASKSRFHVTLGGSAAGAGNVISASDEIGVMIGPGNDSYFAIIQGNFIGTDPTGTIPGQLRTGVQVGGAGQHDRRDRARRGQPSSRIRGSWINSGPGRRRPAVPAAQLRPRQPIWATVRRTGNRPAAFRLERRVTPNDAGDGDTGGNMPAEFPAHRLRPAPGTRRAPEARAIMGRLEARPRRTTFSIFTRTPPARTSRASSSRASPSWARPR